MRVSRPVALSIIAAAWVASTGTARGQEEKACQRAVIGQAAPKFALLANDGTVAISLPATLRQHLPVVVNFWASWCKPCVHELPAIQRVAQELQGKVVFLLVHVGADEDTMKAKLAELHVTLPSASDDFLEVASNYCSAQSIPRTFVIDGSGIIRAVLPMVDESSLRQALVKAGLVSPPAKITGQGP